MCTCTRSGSPYNVLHSTSYTDSDILRTSAYLTMDALPFANTLTPRDLGIAIRLWPFASRYTVPNRTMHQPIRYARNFPGKNCQKKSFTANANQSNESVTRARVASTKVCVCHRELIWFLPPWKLIFNTAKFDFYHRGNWFLPPRKLILPPQKHILGIP